MAKKQTNVAKLARGSKTTKAVATPTEESVKDIDTMAKERVDKLLSDVDLKPPKKEDDLLVLDEEQDMDSLEWLQEQVGKLSEANEKLKNEATEAQENYKKIHAQYQKLIDEGGSAGVDLVPDSVLKNGVTELFNEVQGNYLGYNPERRRYTDIKLVHLLAKMVKTFPFLQEYKRF